MRKLGSAFLTGGVTLALAMPVLALDGISLPGGVESPAQAEEGAAVACPQLVRIKYPFLSCGLDDQGNLVLEPLGQGWSRGLMLEQSAFVEGHGYWGPER